MVSKATAREHIGEYDCWSCSKPTPVKQTVSGRLSAYCTWCDFNHYAVPGSKHHANLLAKVRLYPKPPAEPAKPAEKPTPPATPAPAAASTEKPTYPWMRSSKK